MPHTQTLRNSSSEKKGTQTKLIQVYKSHFWSLHLCQSFASGAPKFSGKRVSKLIEMLLLRANVLYHRSLLRNNDKNLNEQNKKEKRNFRFPFGDFICWGERARTHTHAPIDFHINTRCSIYAPKTCWFDKYWTLLLMLYVYLNFIWYSICDSIMYVMFGIFAISMGLSKNYIFGVVCSLGNT